MKTEREIFLSSDVIKMFTLNQPTTGSTVTFKNVLQEARSFIYRLLDPILSV